MIYLALLFTAFMYFIAPMTFFHIPTSRIQKVFFTSIFGIVIIFARNIYQVFNLPFGTHTILIIIIQIVLLKMIVKELNWLKAIFIAWITVLITIVTEAIVIVPTTKLLSIKLSEIQASPILSFLLTGVGSNIGLIILWLVGKYRNHSHPPNKAI